ncbi:hypothetical protein MMC11_004595 [Xylographa trunciseda]|nr:hypothetical protein [Xylographa trunciseda]
MTDRALHHRRTHNLLLLQRLLSLRDGASPFTLILDSLEQSGRPLIEEYIRRANASKTSVIYIAHSTLNLPPGIDELILARRKDPATLQREISRATSAHSKTLLVLPTLHPLLTPSLPHLLAALLTPSTSLLALLHTDVPAPPAPSPYAPAPLALLRYLATTLFTTHSLAHALARRAAAARSRAPPAFGLAEDRAGVLVALGANDARGAVLEMEHRRKSGRAVAEWFFLPAAEGGRAKVGLLEDCAFWRVEREEVGGSGRGLEVGEEGTWKLGLTERQRGVREGVVAPYLDAQREGGGSGGRILYDMGPEDDFDEEEDEI